MVYDGDFASVASHPGLLERTVLLDGLSKTYAMTGWRCGFAAVPEPLVDPLVRFFVNSTSCVPPFVQLAGVAALSGPQDEPRAMVEEFRARRELVVEGLNALPGVSCRVPRGAFYAFPNVAEVPLESGRARRPAPRGGGRRRPRGIGVRSTRRRQPADQLRELPREPRARARADPRLPGSPLMSALPFDPVVIVGEFAYVSGQIATGRGERARGSRHRRGGRRRRHGRPLRGGVCAERPRSARASFPAAWTGSSGS